MPGCWRSSSSASIFLFVRARLVQDLDLQLARELATVERIYREEPQELTDLDSHWGITLFQVVEGGTVLYRTDGWERGGLSRALRAGGGAAAPQSWVSLEGSRYRVQTVTGSTHDIAAAIEEASLRRALGTLAGILPIGVPCAVALAVAGGYVLAGRVLSPVAAMADTARKITAESLGERLPVDNPDDEFGRLATVFNATLSRLDDSFARLRRFTADASHELRTPLTAMRSVGEVALHGPLDRAAYRDVIGSMLEEVDRLTRLVESLLTLTRADSGRLHLATKPVDLGELATGVVDSLRILAEEKLQTLSVDPGPQVRASGDPAILRQAVINVLDNAIKYTPEHGAIAVRVATTSTDQAAIEVEDTGPGISAVHGQRI